MPFYIECSCSKALKDDIHLTCLGCLGSQHAGELGASLETPTCALCAKISPEDRLACLMQLAKACLASEATGSMGLRVRASMESLPEHVDDGAECITISSSRSYGDATRSYHPGCAASAPLQDSCLMGAAIDTTLEAAMIAAENAVLMALQKATWELRLSHPIAPDKGLFGMDKTLM